MKLYIDKKQINYLITDDFNIIYSVGKYFSIKDLKLLVENIKNSNYKKSQINIYDYYIFLTNFEFETIDHDLAEYLI